MELKFKRDRESPNMAVIIREILTVTLTPQKVIRAIQGKLVDADWTIVEKILPLPEE